MISKQQRIKLELIQIKGIRKLLYEKVDKDVLKSKVEYALRTGEVKDLKRGVERLSRKQLIQIIESITVINDSDIDQIYEQYRYGLKPGFTLFYIHGNSKSIEISLLEKSVEKELMLIKWKEDDKYKQLKYKSATKINENTYELSFTYLSKYTFLSEDEKPQYIYELKDCFVWINIEDMFIAIKNAPNKITICLKNCFGHIYNTRISNIKLTKRVINDVFGDDNMRKGTYFNPNASDSEAQKVTISDPNLSEKIAVRRAFEGYDITNTYIKETINDDLDSTLGINCKQGKIYLTKNLNATNFRDWSIRRIRDIVDYLKTSDISADFDIFRAENIMDDDIWKDFSVVQKEMLEKIIYVIYKHKKDPKSINNIELDFIEMYTQLYKHFYREIVFDCDDCEEMSFGYCKSCGSSQLKCTKDGTIICEECGEIQKDSYEFTCEEGHDNAFGDLESCIILRPTYRVLDNIRTILQVRFDIDFNISKETFYIQGNFINFVGENQEYTIQCSEVKELSPIMNVEVDGKERERLLDEFTSDIKEKCSKSTNKNCNNCDSDEKRFCIMKMFTVFDFRPSPHQNNEFGDVNFEITYKGEKMTLVGIAKSRNSKGDVLNLSDNSTREMLQQLLTMTRDKRVGVIALICPMRFHPQLVKEIQYISKLTKVRVLFFDDDFMIRLLAYYRKLNEK